MALVVGEVVGVVFGRQLQSRGEKHCFHYRLHTRNHGADWIERKGSLEVVEGIRLWMSSNEGVPMAGAAGNLARNLRISHHLETAKE